ncbi:MAG: polyprenyl synthetase family protein [Eubacteriales bacterium]|nr:polyprenyl synthetase family protein [Eubacteriales bacterium]
MNHFDEIELMQEMKLVESCLSDYLRAPETGHAVEQILRDMEQSRGKRLRPRLLLMASRYGTVHAENKERLCRLGALVELVHMASLIHDDIVDDAPLRRGMPTIQSRYGKDMAVYAGDLILSRIVQSLFRDGFANVGSLFGEAVESMCLGELGQMECRGREDVTVEQYIHNIYGKTAALCRLACMAGAIESGCNAEILTQLETLGINFGYMFQIRDDLLDFVSDSAEEGKMTQMDFREGIFTLPVLYALQDPGAKPQILRLIQAAKAGRFSEDHALELRDVVETSGGLDRAAADMEMYAGRALKAIETLPDHGVSDVFRHLLQAKCKIGAPGQAAFS